MKIIRIAKPGKIMKQPPKNPNSDKMDSQIFIGKEDPQHPSKKEKKASPEESIIVAKEKKKKDWDPNPWAVCHTKVDKDKDPEKFERCVQDVKKKQALNLKEIKKEAQFVSPRMMPGQEPYSEDEYANLTGLVNDAAEGDSGELDEATSLVDGELSNYNDAEILIAIKALGEENIAGFSGVREDDVQEVLRICEDYEKSEILDWLKIHRS
jgi:hypothetical protein